MLKLPKAHSPIILQTELCSVKQQYKYTTFKPKKQLKLQNNANNNHSKTTCPIRIKS